MLENELKVKCKIDPKLTWPILFKRFIDDGFCIKLTNIIGELLFIIWTFSYTKATPFIWMANFQSLFIKKRLVSFCTSLFISFLSISSTPSRILFWGERYVRYNLEEKKNFKNLRSRFLLNLRNNGIKKYIHTKLFQHVTYSQRDKLLNTKLPLPNVCEPLIILEAEKEDFSGKKGNIQPFARGRGNFQSSFQFPTFAAAISSATTNNNFNTTTREDTRTLGHH